MYRKLRNKFLFLALVVLMIVCFTAVVFAGSLKAKAADDFQSNGNKISGWYWCRSGGHYAEWTWEPASSVPSKACINFTLLVTNKASGGSGYGCNVKVQILDLNGNVLQTGTAKIYNPFKPQISQNTGGLGYYAYGAYCLKTTNLNLVKTGFKVRILWPPTNKKYHFAAKLESAKLATY